MLRVLFTMAVNVVIARWLYAEIALLMPNVLPYVDQMLAKVQIPTHDQWKDLDTEKLLNEVQPTPAQAETPPPGEQAMSEIIKRLRY